MVQGPAVGAAAVALCALALSACTNSSPESAPEAATRLQKAVSATTAAGTVRFTTTAAVSVSTVSQPPTTTAGVSSLDGSRSVTTARLPDGLVGSSRTFDLQLVVVEPKVWFTFPQAAHDGLPGWGTASTAAARSAADLTLPAVWRLPDWLASLEHVGDVADAGASTVAGAPTTRFTATLPRERDAIGVSLGSFVGGATDARTETVPVQVWVDDLGRVVRIVESWELASGSGAVLTESVTIELGEFGTPVVPRPPTGHGQDVTPGQLLVLASTP